MAKAAVVDRGRIVTLKDHNRHRGISTVMLGDDTLGRDDAGNTKRHISVPFLKGKAKVDDATYRRLKEANLIE